MVATFPPAPPRLPPEPPTIPPPNPARRPHGEETLTKVRDLLTLTTLSHREIGRRTGVHASTVSRLARHYGWYRPEIGGRREDVTPEGRRRLRRSDIAERLLDDAEALLFQTEMNPTATARGIARALRLVRAARKLDEEERLARRAHKRRGRPPPGRLRPIDRWRERQARKPNPLGAE
jgi:hypothetical protein